MALLPEQIEEMEFSAEMEFVDYPSYAWYIDPQSKRIFRMTDGLEAVRQTVEILLLIERYRFSIFTHNCGMEWEGLVGSDYGYCVSELTRRLKDTFVPDNRILDVTDFQFRLIPPDSMACGFTILTVFGAMPYQIDDIRSLGGSG